LEPCGDEGRAVCVPCIPPVLLADEGDGTERVVRGFLFARAYRAVERRPPGSTVP
jgi:hypothetical protein